ncbi:MAG: carboxy terminal-processing peptidase [Cellvibrionales bacterium]|nr:carboxy terminal-processing peptidase [Cellvibrionales bacterium]
MNCLLCHLFSARAGLFALVAAGWSAAVGRGRRAVGALVLAGGLVPVGGLAGESECPAVDPALEMGALAEIAFGKDDSRTLESVLTILNKNYYREVAVDDELSAQWLENYLEMLDPGKNFFLQSDVERFTEKYGAHLDELAKAGDLEAARQIYLQFRIRAMAQLGATLKRLENDKPFDYKSDAVLPLDRDDYEWPRSMREARARAAKRLTLTMLNFKLSGKEAAAARKDLVRRYQAQLANVRQQDSQQVLDIYLDALGQVYDPHTVYFSPLASENHEIDMSLSLEGIGAILQREYEFTKVVSLMPGGPAEMQGELGAADRIVAVGEGTDCAFVDIIGWPLDKVVQRIRGAKGTRVRLKVIPAEAGEFSAERKVVEIVRDRVRIENKAAKGEVLEIESGGEEYRLGVIDIPMFYIDLRALADRDSNYRSVTGDVRRILDEFAAEDVDGVIVDLRQNMGGELRESARVTDLFVGPGPIVQILDRNGRIYRNHRARGPAHYTGPLVVLIDRLSASASEIFAGAIQDYGRGLIVGSQSFGKGTVQGIQSLPTGQLKLTRSKFYRISGDSTQHKGVVPDIELPGLFDPLDIGESAAENALGWDQIRGIPHRRYADWGGRLAPLRAKHRARLEADADLRYLLGSLALAAERRGQESVSLNEAVRVAEREAWEARQDGLKAAWREARGILVEEDSVEMAGAEESGGAGDSLGGSAAGTGVAGTGDAAGVDSGAALLAAAGKSGGADSAGEGLAAEAGEEADEGAETEPDVNAFILRETGRIFADLLRMERDDKRRLAAVQRDEE